MKNMFNCNFPNYGFVACDLTDDEFLPLLEEINDIQNNFDLKTRVNNDLIGNIENEFKLEKNRENLQTLSNKLINLYNETYNPRDDNNYELLGTWANFQKKHEFNPVHTHLGKYSFVIYVKIPFLMKDELEYIKNVPLHFNRTAHFNFHYTNSLGEIRDWPIPVDKTYERRMMLFPAKMSHSVCPFFTSDEYRVSVSGNLDIKK
jgi:hypothetical protein